jgi:hypothetical protein
MHHARQTERRQRGVLTCGNHAITVLNFNLCVTLRGNATDGAAATQLELETRTLALLAAARNESETTKSYCRQQQ